MKQQQKQTGLTLVELMIAMAIGLFLMLGAVTIYSQGRTTYKATETTARIQENMRFAFDVLETDVRLGGFWGQHNVGASVFTAGAAATCGGNTVSNWVLDVTTTIEATNNVPSAANTNVAPNCAAFGGGVVADTDVLVVRRVTGQPRALDNGRLQVQSDLDKSRVFTNGTIPGDFDPLTSTTHDVIFNAWYLSEDSNAMPGVPSLRRRTLNDTAALIDEEVIAGVENFQIQLGVDTDDDGDIERFVDPNAAIVATSRVVSVRIYLLMRSEFPENGFIDGRTYVLPDAVLADYTPNDNFRRLAASKTITLRNARG